MKRIKVLQLGKAYPPVNLGGVEIVIQLLAEGLNKDGVECDALGANEVYKYQMERGPFGGKIFRTKLIAKKFSTLISVQLITVLAKIWREYDIIHIHTPDPMAALAMFLVRPKTKVVLHWHSDILKQKFIYFFYKPLLNWLSNRADKIVATSPNYIDDSYFLSKYESKVLVIPIGIDVQIFKESSSDLEKRYQDKTIIFSLGRLAYYKGFEYLVKAATYLNSDMVIVIAGEGEERDKLENMVAEYNLTEKVKLVGKISEIDKQWYFSRARVFALSSVVKTEAFAIVQVEAMAYGLPVVSTRIKGSGVDWVNQHNETGITVPIRDAKAIADAIILIDSDSSKYELYKHNAKLRYQTVFTHDNMIVGTVNLYREVLS